MINWQQNFMSSYSVIKQIRRTPATRRPILLITRMITDRIGLHSVLYHYLSTFIENSEKNRLNQANTDS